MLFANAVEKEIERARESFPPMSSWHEGYAVILEELDEYFFLVKTKGSTTTEMVLELIQVAAMCQRTAEDVMAQDNPLAHNESSPQGYPGHDEADQASKLSPYEKAHSDKSKRSLADNAREF